ncbi:amidase family protein [Candidatus Nasuia deltocephalinicola]|uniref:amidase family protein n=1 Tax=Candidatus Nasuia deltocephalincola TaxID=1160784 RepID=UPI00216AF7D1|nr:amidase family protein [Candidatus Nasuia deltocephalinicola]
MNLLRLYYLIYFKKIKPFDLSKFILKKIENLLFKNYFINIDYNYIKKQCLYSEKLLLKNKNNLLTGIPTTYKDIFSTKNIPTTAGSRILKNYNIFYNATFLNKLNNLGVINIGKNNMDEFCVGSNTFNFYFGKVENPLNKNFTIGGSSGGSVYLVSKNIIPFSIGSDTGGSVRQPATLNNVIGFKPTYGLISRYGLLAYSSSMDTVGIFSKNILNISIVLNAITGFDVKDPTTFNLIKEDYTRYLNKNWLLNRINSKKLTGLNVGVSKKIFNNIYNFSIRSNIEDILLNFEFLGAKIIFINILFFDFVTTIYNIISSSELYSNISKYNNKFLFDKTYYFLYKKTFFNSLSINTKNKFFIGNYLISSDKNKKFFFLSKKIRILIIENFKKIFTFCDIIILPTISYNNLKFLNLNLNKNLDKYTSVSNLTGLPSISIPSKILYYKNFKFFQGFQIIGNYFSEAKLIQIIYEYEKNFFKCF